MTGRPLRPGPAIRQTEGMPIRPEPSEAAPYYFTYIDRVPDGDIVQTLATSA